MPIYEYECGACGEVTDILHKISDKPPRKCPSCGAMKLKRLISAPKFRLKGDGWYETDFKTGDKRNLADGGDAGKESSKDGADSKADKKDAAAKDANGKTKKDKPASTKTKKSGGEAA